MEPKKWLTDSINPTCEVLIGTTGKFCDKPTTHAYPCMNSGWQSLCALHALKHPEAFNTDELIAKGETWK